MFAVELALIILDSAVTPMAEPVEVDTATVRRLPVSATGPKRRAYRWAAAAAALLGVLGASAVAALLSRASEPAHARTTVASAQPLPEARAEAVAALAPVREAEPERQPAPALRRVRIESRPSGAGIAIDGRRQCTAPCELELPQRPVEVEAKLPGHVAARKRLSAPLPDRLAFDLTPKRPQPPGVERPDPGLPPLLPR